MQAEAAPAVVLLDLPEECLVAVCAAVAASAEAARLPVALARLQASCRALRDLPADRAAWLPACRRRWSARPRWMERLERQLQTEAASGAAGVAVGGSPGAVPFRGGTWRDRLNEAEAEAARPLSAAQLQGMRWFLRFKNDATGIVSRPQAAEFSAAGLFVLGYPPLPYKLDPDGLFAHEVNQPCTLQLSELGCSCEARPEQALLIASFPAHRVTRLPDSWEFLIENQHVDIWSVVDATDGRVPAELQSRHPNPQGADEPAHPGAAPDA
mmetsp:Transcript_44283/g.111206  ORF Transcript_44283/g.111206 Transcript_44283/m.111206 type:complete len:269 (+) Transcript_44283:159-965(+)|eukprot:jgi/Tetstr1/436471/TSEL_025299.t1